MQNANVLPIGTTLSVGELICVICGYRSIDYNGHVRIAHVAVPYPLGFANEESLLILLPELQYEVIQDGYATAESVAFMKILQNVVDAELDASELDDYHQFLENVFEVEMKGRLADE